MEIREPLTELGNQRLPRRRTAATYGKKKGAQVSVQHAQRALFGQDENNIENTFSNLQLDDTELIESLSRSSKTWEYNPVETDHNSHPQSEKPIISDTTIKLKTPKEVYLSSIKPPCADHDAILPLLNLSEYPIEPFTIFGSKVAKSCSIEKIGEGSFAEVFKLTPLKSKTVSKSDARKLPPSSIIKIIPLAHPTSSVSALDRVSTVDSVAREITLLSHLNSLHGFTTFSSLRLVQGMWPKSFLESFYEFQKQNKKRALNASPEDDFDKNQIYALIEMGDAGLELALIKKPSVFVVWDVFWSVVVMLGNAEEKTEFEHRDLHLSNICVKPGKSKNTIVYEDGNSGSEPQLDIDSQLLLNMEEIPTTRLGLSGLKVTIIDYTVSRAQLPTSTQNLSPGSIISTPVNTDSKQDERDQERILYDNMNFISEPFEPTSDAEAALQFKTYQRCRTLVNNKHASKQRGAASSSICSSFINTTTIPPPSETMSKWQSFNPETNTLWLSYLLQTLLNRARSPRSRKLHILTVPKTNNNNKTTTMITKQNKLLKTLQESMWNTLEEINDYLINFTTCNVDVNEDDSVPGNDDDNDCLHNQDDIRSTSKVTSKATSNSTSKSTTKSKTTTTTKPRTKTNIKSKTKSTTTKNQGKNEPYTQTTSKYKPAEDLTHHNNDNNNTTPNTLPSNFVSCGGVGSIGGAKSLLENSIQNKWLTISELELFMESLDDDDD